MGHCGAYQYYGTQYSTESWLVHKRPAKYIVPGRWCYDVPYDMVVAQFGADRPPSTTLVKWTTCVCCSHPPATEMPSCLVPVSFSH
ncbi:unnamed protein product [Ectocarpus sp. 8 AP-2014]